MSLKNRYLNRHYFVDNLRILLVILVVIAHLSITYGAEGGWYYFEHTSDTFSNAILQFIISTVQAFVLGLFFLISGFFTPKTYQRKGAKNFIKDRLFRLGLPLLIYEALINPLLVYLNVIMVQGVKISYWDFFRQNMLPPKIIGTGPLWFVVALLLFSFVYVLYAKIMGKNEAEVVKSPFPSNLAIGFFVFMITTVTFLIRIKLPIGWSLKFFHLQFPFYTQYICFFIIGIIAYKKDWLFHIPVAMGKLWLRVGIVAMLCFPLLAFLGGALRGEALKFIGGFNWQSYAYGAWESFICFGMSIGLLSLFQRKLNKENKLSKILSSNTFSVYVIHAPIIVFLSYTLQSIIIHPLLKFALVSLIAVPLCFLISNYVILKIPFARKIL
ncbi:MAG: acyltransferase family protein [Clostridia bacterium]